jgi:RND family efflux transporter MFP subunit
MRGRSVPVLVLGAAGVLLLLAFWLFWTSPAAETRREAERRRAAAATAAAPIGADARPNAAAPPIVTVDAVTVRATSARAVVEVSGVLAPVRSVVVGAEVPGRVIAVEVEEHTPVAEGDVLVRLDPELFQAAVARARAALLSAEAARRLALAELRRRRQLSEQGVASPAELDRAESEAQTTAARVAEARAALLDVETRLRKTEIRAPFAGLVSDLELEPGAYLGPGDRVAELADLAQVEIEVGVSDEEILALHDGGAARVAVRALPGRWFDGRVVRPGRTADPETRKYPVPVRVDNPEGLLLPGMLGTVRFELGEAREALRISRRAVQREFDLHYLYVLEPFAGDGAIATARQRRVRTRPVAFHPELLEVSEGLAAGERVALTGLRELREGMRVRVREGWVPGAREDGS